VNQISVDPDGTVLIFSPNDANIHEYVPVSIPELIDKVNASGLSAGIANRRNTSRRSRLGGGNS
jgi:hypothetical protein